MAPRFSIPLLLSLFPACAEDQNSDSGRLPDSGELLDGPSLFARASLDARGYRPSLSELQALPQEPDGIQEAIGDLADSPELGQRLAWIWNERIHSVMWASQVERFDIYEGEGWTEENARVAGQEVLQFMRLLVDEDRSLRELVTAQGVPVHHGSPAHWPTTQGESTWSWGSYTDERPVSGVLSSPAMWLRYTDDALNYHRYRANVVSQVFLCRDFFDKPAILDFQFDPSVSSIEDAVKTDPACLSCHASLDPLGAHFGGFAEKSVNFSSESFLSYSSFNESWTTSLTQPAYFGHKSTGIESLGALIASDPRFSRCMVETLYEGLVGLEFSQEPQAENLVAHFRDNDMEARPLVRAILELESYQQRSPRLLTNTQMRSNWMQLLDVDSGDLASEALDALLWDPELGIMGGAGDDVQILIPNREATMTRAVLVEWAAKSIARAALERESIREISDQRLLGVEFPLSEDELRSLVTRWLNLLTSSQLTTESDEAARVWELYNALQSLRIDNDDQLEVLALLLEALMQHPLAQVY